MGEMDPFVLPESHCLNCGKRLNRASSLEATTAPDPGDITICVECGHVMAFAEDLSHRQLTDAEIVEIAGDPDIIATQRMLAEYREHLVRVRNKQQRSKQH